MENGLVQFNYKNRNRLNLGKQKDYFTEGIIL